MAVITKPRVVLSEGEWQELIEKQEASGLTVKDFCDQQGVSRTSFFRWRRLIRKSNQAEQRTSSRESNNQPQSSNGALFAQLEIPEQVTQTTQRPDSQSSSWDIELELGDGICLRIRKGAS